MRAAAVAHFDGELLTVGVLMAIVALLVRPLEMRARCASLTVTRAARGRDVIALERKTKARVQLGLHG